MPTLVVGWLALSVILSLAAMQTHMFWSRIPFVVSCSTLFLWFFSHLLEKNTIPVSSIWSLLQDDPKSPTGDSSIIQQPENHEYTTNTHATTEKENPSTIMLFSERWSTLNTSTRLMLAHLLCDYVYHVTCYLVSNRTFYSQVRSLEPSITFLMFSKNSSKTDGIFHMMVALLVVLVQWFAEPFSIPMIICVIANFACLTFRNHLVVKWHSENRPIGELAEGAKTSTKVSLVVMVLVYIVRYDVLDVEWFWFSLLFGAFIFAVMAACNFVMLKIIDLIQLSTISLLERTVTMFIFFALSPFSFQFISYSHYATFCIIGLGLVAVIVIYCSYVNNLVSVKQSIVTFASFTAIAMLVLIFVVGNVMVSRKHNTIRNRSNITTKLPRSDHSIRVAILSGAGITDIGHNIFLQSWVSNLKKFNEKLEIYSLSAEYCCYNYDESFKFEVKTVDHLSNTLHHIRPHYVLITGKLSALENNLLSSINNTNEWDEKIIKPFPQTSWIVASLGVEEQSDLVNIQKMAPLLRHAVVVTGRNKLSRDILEELLKDKPVTILPHPALVDSTSFPITDPSPASDNEKVNCWFPQNPTSTEMYHLIHSGADFNKDAVIASAYSDGNFFGAFKSDVSVYSHESQHLFRFIQKYCKLVITTRSHAAILAFRASVPSIGLESPTSHTLAGLFQLAVGTDINCVYKDLENHAQFKEKMTKCYQDYDKENTRQRLVELEKQIQSFLKEYIKL